MRSRGSAQVWLGGEARGVVDDAVKQGSSPAPRPGSLCADWESVRIGGQLKNFLPKAALGKV